MSTPGRKPKPTALKVLEGNPGKRDLNEGEPKPLPIAPDCPEWLVDEAKEVWNKLTPVLERMGVLTEADEIALAAVCSLYIRYKDLEKIIDDKGYTEKNSRSGVKAVPEFAMSRDCLKLLKSFITEFGLTPSSRTRINVAESSQDDPLEEFFR
jgi:P27 family predicted phage terminase small subunit